MSTQSDLSLDRIERYKVLAQLGVGGMAEVFRVVHRDLKTTHAMKVLRIAAPALQERLMLEGRVQAGLRHKNVVAVTDMVRTPSGIPALVMEYVDGPTLFDALQFFRPTLDQVDAIARGILRGVRAAHEQKMIHRDLKPENIMLALLDGEVVPKITDFGLAKLLGNRGTSNTRTGMALGTAKYMAPEQFRNAKAVDHRADIFSIGTILYRLTTGKYAFQGRDFITMYGEAANENYVRVGTIAPHLPMRMQNAIEGCLKADVNERIQNLDELLGIWCDGVAQPRNVWEPQHIEYLRSISGDLASEATKRTELYHSDANAASPSEATQVGPSLVPYTTDIEPVSAVMDPANFPPRPPRAPRLPTPRVSAAPSAPLLNYAPTADSTPPRAAAPRVRRSRSPWVAAVVAAGALFMTTGVGLGALVLPSISGIARAEARVHAVMPSIAAAVDAQPRMVVEAAQAGEELPVVAATPVVPETWIAIDAGNHSVGNARQNVPESMLVREYNWKGPTLRGENPGFPLIPAARVHTVELSEAALAPELMTWGDWGALGGEVRGEPNDMARGLKIADIETVLNAASLRDGLDPAMEDGSWNGANGYRLPTEAEWEVAIQQKATRQQERVLDPEAIPRIPGRGRPGFVLRGDRDLRTFRWADTPRMPFRIARAQVSK